MTTTDARQQIQDALLSYCRGIDRLDAELVARGFHPGAVLSDYGADPMVIETFAEYAPASLQKRFSATQHRISNTTVDFDDGGSAATVETYGLAYHVEPTENGDVLHTFNGRYIDRFEQRNGAWKIATRHLRNDWSEVQPLGEPMRGAWVASGRAGSPDPLWD